MKLFGGYLFKVEDIIYKYNKRTRNFSLISFFFPDIYE